MEPTTRFNYDPETVKGFGDEWSRFDQSALSWEELERQFETYFRIFPWDELPQNAVGFEMGCGSGRWAKLVAPKVGRLVCIDASDAVLEVCRRNLEGMENCDFVLASVDSLPFKGESMDFGYSLGVLHHVPDTAGGIASCVAKLKRGAPLLLYIYYALDNRPAWFRALWRMSDAIRKVVSRLPFRARYYVTQIFAALVYYPLARLSLLTEKMGFPASTIPLSAYRRSSFYTMRTDALDRFGTRVEQRFTRSQIQKMMENAGLERITFSDSVPYWCILGYKKSAL
jgi:ubiquinone/menaquinone biosynthesis C-methylase UbiE